MSRSSLLTSSDVELAPVPPVPHKEALPPPPTMLSGKVEGSLQESIGGVKIKKFPVHPGSGPRAQRGLKIKTHIKPKLLNSELQSPAPPLDGAAAPLVGMGCSGPLAVQAESWRACAVHPWVLSTIMRGYRLQFAVKPPVFNSVLMSAAEGKSAQVLEEEIASLLRKRAIRVVPPEDSHQGFYSRYFVIPKRGGGLRPILDLRILNKHLRKYKFKMPTFKTLSHFIREKDWFTSVDLEDAYFHIGIYPSHRKFLRFAYQGTAYEFMTVPFGLSLAPRTFCRCIEAALSPLRTAGLRVSAYLDDLLLCSPSRQQAETDTKSLVSHLVSLGFKINETKSCLVPTQEIVYLGLRLNSDQYQAFLSEERIRSIRGCLSLFQKGRKVPFRLCLRLLGLMASTVSVIPLGLLRMREFQNWTASLHLCPKRHLNRKVIVSALCMRALRYWKNRSFLESGTPLGAVSMRKVVTTDVSLSGWGAVCEGRIAKGKWPISLRRAHINYLELLTVFLALKHFVQFLRNHHVLIRSDNTTTVAYVNRQGGTRSPQLHSLAQKLIVWGRKHFHSLRATHVPGIMNAGADLLSRGNPRYSEWSLHPQVVGQLWKRFGRAAVDLFASRENSHCPLFFSLARDGAPMGVDALAHQWPNVLLYAFPPLSLIIPTLRRVREYGHSVILIAPNWPGESVAGGDNAAFIRPAVASPATQRPPLAGARGDIPPCPGQGCSLGLARERLNLNARGLPSRVIEKIQNARAASTRSAYGKKWNVFEQWCAHKRIVPFLCSVADVLCFLQELLEKGRAFSTVKVYLAAISACHVGIDDNTMGRHPLVCRFMRGARRLNRVSRPLIPPWDLSVVLNALSRTPFEPIDSGDLKLLSLKTALLLALSTAKRVSELHALSVHNSCMQFTMDYSRVSLKTNPAFVPKVSESALAYNQVDLMAFHPPPFSSPEEERLHCLCPVRALRCYVNRTKALQKSNQLFVSWADSHRGKPISRQRLSHWIVEAIIVGYNSMGLSPPEGLRAHSTQGLASSWAWFKGVSIRDICAAASWASPHTFVKFYKLDVTEPSLAHSVLIARGRDMLRMRWGPSCSDIYRGRRDSRVTVVIGLSTDRRGAIGASRLVTPEAIPIVRYLTHVIREPGLRE
ncbi:Transposon Ty3-G Gag-Pol polyprotein [Labeo rohita]|uniref:ribonuclease H n=1 Tax=Labeo rohita TaxID=84645 RepID=A0ABQ8L894_LABRO|nr:Transposon Ty3-G Gag-Pol polyprotein [Labeo rohita]